MSYRQFEILCSCLIGAVLAPSWAIAHEEREPAPLATGGFIQQLRSLPANSIASSETMESNGNFSDDPTPSVVRAQAEARAHANQGSSQYRLPAQPTGRATLQRTHQSPWLERLTQDDRAQESLVQPQPGQYENSKVETPQPVYRSVQGRRSMLADPSSTSGRDDVRPPDVLTPQQVTRQGFSLSDSSPQSARSPLPKHQLSIDDIASPGDTFSPNDKLSPKYTGEVHVELDLPGELRANSSSTEDSSSKRAPALTTRSESREPRSEAATPKLPARYSSKQPKLELAAPAKNESNALTSESLQLAPRVSRVPLPRPASKEPTSSTAKAIAPSTLSDKHALNDSAPSEPNAKNEPTASAPKRIPAITASASPLPGTMRISSATLQTTVGDVVGQGVRVPAQLSDATRAERDLERPVPSSPVASTDAKSANQQSLSDHAQTDDPASLSLELPQTPLPSTSPSGTSRPDASRVETTQQGTSQLGTPQLGTTSRSDAPSLPPLPALPALPAIPALPSSSSPAAPMFSADRQPEFSSPATTDSTPAFREPSTASPSLQMPKLVTEGRQSRVGNEPVTSPDQRLRMEAPHVQVLLNGPADLPVGTPANYEVVVRNQDAIDLRGLILRLDIPAGVQVQALRPTHGQFEVEQAADGLTMLTWGFEHLAAGQTATAPMQLVTSTPKNFAVAMEWTLMPIAGTSSLEVRAPRLELALEGASEVRFGQPNVYRLHVRNPGNASANAVAVRLSAEPYGSSAAEIAHIAPGEEEVIDVELTFNERGAIKIVAQAQEQSGLSSQTAISVVVRQALVQSQLIATEMVYHGSPAEYRIRLSNTGDADASNLQARLQLPAGASLISAPAGATLVGRELTWSVAKLAAGSTEDFPVQLNLTAEGANLTQFSCSGPGQVSTAAQASTQVEAITDLKLVVNDPIAPAPVGGEVVYELTLTNRGSKGATNVKVTAQFSEGIEPVRGEGQPARVVPGQTLFEPITRIGAGETVRLKVIAKAAEAGTHRFRVEVRSDDSEVRLVQEESTQYLQGASRMASPQAPTTLR